MFLRRHIFSIMLASLFLYSGSVTAAPIKLSYVAHHVESDVHSKLIKEWIDRVETLSNNEVKITFYPGESKVSGPQTYNAVQHGYVDIGFSVIEYTRGRFPLMEFIDLPLGFENGRINTAIINEVYEKFRPEEFNNVKVLYLMATGPHYLHSISKPDQFVLDLHDKKVHYSGIADQIVAALGGTPVSLPMGKLYKALLKNDVDAGFWDFAAGQNWKFAEIAMYDIVCPQLAQSAGLYVIMNQDSWDHLSPKVQKVIEQLNSEWAIKHGQAWDSAAAQGLAYSRTLGNSLISVPDKEINFLKKALQPVIQDYIDKTVSMDLPGREVVNYVNKRLDEYHNGTFQSRYLSD